MLAVWRFQAQQRLEGMEVLMTARRRNGLKMCLLIVSGLVVARGFASE